MKTQSHSRRVDVRKIAMTGMLSAVAAVLMFLSFSIPLVPSFLKMDFSELPALIASFAFGPVSGAAVCLVKNLVNVLSERVFSARDMTSEAAVAKLMWALGRPGERLCLLNENLCGEMSR